MNDARQIPGPSRGPSVSIWCAAVALLGCGLLVGWRNWQQPRPAFAAAAAVQDAFAVCTAPVGDGMEGFFMLDFETGDISGGVLSQNTSKFTVGYRHNVLKDLGFKAGKVKNPKFLLVAGLVNFIGPSAARLGQSVLYVTDVSTGVTAAYGVPWAAAVGAGARATVNPLVLLDVVRPRGGGEKAP